MSAAAVRSNLVPVFDEEEDPARSSMARSQSSRSMGTSSSREDSTDDLTKTRRKKKKKKSSKKSNSISITSSDEDEPVATGGAQKALKKRKSSKNLSKDKKISQSQIQAGVVENRSNNNSFTSTSATDDLASQKSRYRQSNSSSSSRVSSSRTETSSSRRTRNTNTEQPAPEASPPSITSAQTIRSVPGDDRQESPLVAQESHAIPPTPLRNEDHYRSQTRPGAVHVRPPNWRSGDDESESSSRLFPEEDNGRFHDEEDPPESADHMVLATLVGDNDNDESSNDDDDDKTEEGISTKWWALAACVAALVLIVIITMTVILVVVMVGQSSGGSGSGNASAPTPSPTPANDSASTSQPTNSPTTIPPTHLPTPVQVEFSPSAGEPSPTAGGSSQLQDFNFAAFYAVQWGFYANDCDQTEQIPSEIRFECPQTSYMEIVHFESTINQIDNVFGSHSTGDGIYNCERSTDTGILSCTPGDEGQWGMTTNYRALFVVACAGSGVANTDFFVGIRPVLAANQCFVRPTESTHKAEITWGVSTGHICFDNEALPVGMDFSTTHSDEDGICSTGQPLLVPGPGGSPPFLACGDKRTGESVTGGRVQISWEQNDLNRWESIPGHCFLLAGEGSGQLEYSFPSMVDLLRNQFSLTDYAEQVHSFQSEFPTLH